MQYNASIEKAEMDDYEGHLLINIGDQEFLVSYLAPLEFAKKSLLIESCPAIVIDLWLVYGDVEKSTSQTLEFPTSKKIAGGLVRGKVIEIFSKRQLRIDCGLIIDIESENDVDIEVGEIVETIGTYKIYFPGTDFEKS